MNKRSQRSKDDSDNRANYLGDGVCIRCNNSGQAEIYTFDGVHEENLIYLAPEVAKALVDWFAERGIKCNR